LNNTFKIIHSKVYCSDHKLGNRIGQKKNHKRNRKVAGKKGERSAALALVPHGRGEAKVKITK
jgi:hypothetical protein